MTDRELKTLKDNLWHAADVLRSGAHLAANKYGQPILGLIFLRYADILFKQHKDEIDAEYTKRLGTRMEKTSNVKRLRSRSAASSSQSAPIMTLLMTRRTQRRRPIW